LVIAIQFKNMALFAKTTPFSPKTPLFFKPINSVRHPSSLAFALRKAFFALSKGFPQGETPKKPQNSARNRSSRLFMLSFL